MYVYVIFYFREYLNEEPCNWMCPIKLNNNNKNNNNNNKIIIMIIIIIIIIIVIIYEIFMSRTTTPKYINQR